MRRISTFQWLFFLAMCALIVYLVVGLGLKNTRARLSEIYGEDYSFRLSRRENEWTVAQIVIPFFPTKEQPKGELH